MSLLEKIEHIADKIIFLGFALIALIVPLLLTPFNYELFEFNKMIAVYGITALIVGAWVSKMIAQKRIYIAKTPFDIPIILFVVSQLVSTLFSIDPHVSWFGYYSRFNGGIISVFCYTLLFYAFVSNIKRADITKLGIMLFSTASIVSLYGVLEHFGIDKHLWVQDVQSRVFSTLGQPNWLAAYVVALFPITLALAYQRKSNWPTALLPAGCTLLLFLTLLYTRSRSGLLAFAAIDILFWAIALIKEKQKRGWRMAFFLSHIMFAIMFFFTGINVPTIDKYTTFSGWQQQLTKAKQDATASAENKAQNPPIQEEVTGPVLETGGTESGVIRSFVWQGAVNAWKSSTKTKLIGTGTETFAFAFYKSKPIAHNLTSEWDFLYNKAHNEYLNYLATTGAFGLGTYLTLLFIVAIWTIRHILRGTDLYPTTGILLGWISILITNFFGFSVVVIQLLFFLLPGALFILHQQQTEGKSRNEAEKMREIQLPLTRQWQYALSAAALLLTVLCIGAVGATWVADKTFASGYRQARANQYAPAYSSLAAAVAMNPNEPLYHDEFSNTLATLAVAAFDNQDATLSATLAQYAIAENEKAIAISPNNVNFWKSRTKIYYTLSILDEALVQPAIQSLIRAEALSPADPKIAYNLAILSGRLNDGAKAVMYLSHAIDLKPNYRDAYYALFVFYKDMNQPENARAIINTYLTTVNSQDEEFKKLVE